MDFVIQENCEICIPNDKSILQLYSTMSHITKLPTSETSSTRPCS